MRWVGGIVPLFVGWGSFVVEGGRFVLWGALLAWGALGGVWGRSPFRRVLCVGATATLTLALMSSMWGGTFFFHRVREISGWRFSWGIVGVQGVLMTTCLLIYSLMRTKIGRELASVMTALCGLGLGWTFEQLGKELWVWNAYILPRAFWGGVPAFVPVAWGMCFLFSGYFLSERHMPCGGGVLVGGIRCGAAYGASFLLWWAIFLKWHGRAVAF